MTTVILTESPREVLNISTPCFITRYADEKRKKWMLDLGIIERNMITWVIDNYFLDKNKVFLDIGANMGHYSILMSKYCKEIHAFEACKRIAYSLCGSIVLNDCDNITVYNEALGSPENEGKILNMTVAVNDGANSSFHPNWAKTLSSNNDVDHIESKVIKTLDSFDIKHVDFIKIDVEGYEHEVLKGCIETIEISGYPPILFESCVGPHLNTREEFDNLKNFLENIGYKITNMKSFDLYIATKTM